MLLLLLLLLLLCLKSSLGQLSSLLLLGCNLLLLLELLLLELLLLRCLGGRGGLRADVSLRGCCCCCCVAGRHPGLPARKGRVKTRRQGLPGSVEGGCIGGCKRCALLLL